MSNDAMKHGHFSWNELLTNDTAKSIDFFSKLLGWTTDEMPMPSGTYYVLKDGDSSVGGLMEIQKEWGEVPPNWMSYITVDDVDASAKKAVELGAKVLAPPMDIPKVGRFCTIQDPTGAVVSLITYKMEE